MFFHSPYHIHYHDETSYSVKKNFHHLFPSSERELGHFTHLLIDLTFDFKPFTILKIGPECPPALFALSLSLDYLGKGHLFLYEPRNTEPYLRKMVGKLGLQKRVIFLETLDGTLPAVDFLFLSSTPDLSKRLRKIQPLLQANGRIILFMDQVEEAQEHIPLMNALFTPLIINVDTLPAWGIWINQ